MKLTTKIMSGLSVIIIGMLIIAVTSYNGIHKMGEEIKEIAEYEAPLLNTIVEIEKDILKEEVLTLELILASSNVKSHEFKEIEENIEKLEIDTTKNILKCQVLANKAAIHAHDKKLKSEYLHISKVCHLFEKEQKQFENLLKELEHDLETGNHSNIESKKKTIFYRVRKDGSSGY